MIKTMGAGMALLALAGCAAQPGSLAQPPLQQAFQAFGNALANPQGAMGGQVNAAQVSSSVAPREGKMVTIDATNVMVEAPHPKDARWTDKRIQDTPLSGLFKRYPIAKPGQYWPRVSITIDDYSESLLVNEPLRYMAQRSPATMPNVARPPECIKFDAVIWFAEKKSQKVDGVTLCNGDLKADGMRLTIGAMRNYASLMPPYSISSEQVRTAGPRVPNPLLPRDNEDAVRLYGNGRYLFAELFLGLAYRGPLDGDQRLWFVNLADKREGAQ